MKTSVCGTDRIFSAAMIIAAASIAGLALFSACQFDPRGLGAACGDGIRQGSEECDGGDLGGISCTDLGYDGGVLGCSPQCRFITDGCTDDGTDMNSGTNNDSTDLCGNGILDAGEDCDGTELGGRTCETLGFDGGQLSCTARCRLDVTRCTGDSSPVCGNGLLDSGEECDDGTSNSDTRADACRTDCRLPHCGDGVVDSGEVCDGTSFGTLASCADLGSGYHAAPLVCTGSCTIDISACPSCGDGNLDTQYGEECDDGTSNSDTRADACRTDCRLPHCGDGVMDSGEECDGTDFGSVTSCRDLDSRYYAAMPACTQSCHIDDSVCPYCGDGVTNDVYGEVCDVGTASATIMTMGDFTGWCEDECRQVRVFDQVGMGDGELQSSKTVRIASGGDIVVSGHTNGDLLGTTLNSTRAVYLIRYDDAGNTVDGTVYESDNSVYAWSMNLASDGSIWISGSVKGDLPGFSSAGGLDAYVKHMTSSFSGLFTYQFGTSLNDSGTRIVQTSPTQVYVMGRWYDENSTNSNKGFVFLYNPQTDRIDGEDYDLRAKIQDAVPNATIRDLELRAFLVTSDGVYVGGMAVVDYPGNGSSNASEQAVVMKFDRNLSHVWTAVIGSSSNGDDEWVRTLVETNNTIYVVGYYSGSTFAGSGSGWNVFVMPINRSTGAFDTTDCVILGGDGDDYVMDGVVVGQNLYMVGYTTSTSLGGASRPGNDQDGFMCSVNLTAMQAGQCMFIGTPESDRLYSVDYGTVGGVPTLVMGGRVNGAIEPGIQKDDTGSSDGVVVILKRSSF